MARTAKMTTYISMLRGVNVGGQKRIRMEDLLDLYKSLGFENIKTYVQSGNIIFDVSDGNYCDLVSVIEAKIRQLLNLSVVIILRTPGEFQRLIDNNPFLTEAKIKSDKLHVTFLSQVPTKSDLNRVQKEPTRLDRFVIKDREIYLYCPNGYSKTRFSNVFFEKKLGVKATTRNWKTVNMLLKIASE